MNIGGVEYNTAPAAFGVYTGADIYQTLDHINPAMLNSAPYSLSHFVSSPYGTVMSKDFHLGYDPNANVDPSQLDVSNHGFVYESAQSESDPEPKARKPAEPTNVLVTQKMDRKTLKRLRNRVSASRCRTKKKEWIQEMEETNALLDEENSRLQDRVSELQISISRAKEFIARAQLRNG